MIEGKVWIFGDDINTDLILPSPYMYLPAAKQARHVFEPNRPGWVDEVSRGDFIVAGKNFGTGSSRPAPLALNALGIKCVITDSMNPLFFRNCVSFGLLALECPGVLASFKEGDMAEVSMDQGQVRNRRTGTALTGVPIPPALLSLMQGGGIFPLLESEGLIGPATEADAEAAS
jgi:3-isopropylmalate/(R)-2-methylmalate dehydratase small subunit